MSALSLADSSARFCRVELITGSGSDSARLSSLTRMSSKSERRAARQAVGRYHEDCLAELVQRVGDAVDRFRAGELDAFEADQAIFQYSRAANELWKFCNLSDAEVTASMIDDRLPIDWWERGAPRRR
jgi:hypothetical protein